MKNSVCVKVLIIALVFLIGNVNAQVGPTTAWDKEVKVTQGPVDFPGKETHYSYSTLVYETDKSSVQKMVLAELDSQTADKTKKKALKEGVPIALPAFGGEEVSVKATAEDIKGSAQVKVSVAFFKDSMEINPTDFPKEDKSAQEVLQNLGVTLNKAVVSSQIETANKDLESLQKDFDKLVRDSIKLNESIAKSNEQIMNLKANNMKQEGKLSKAESEAASLEVMANSDAATAKDMKKYSNAKSKATSIESSMMKNNQKITGEESDIKEAEMELPMVKKQVEDLAAQIEKQKELITALQAKLEAVK